jgi:type I restriction enzyme S subunit
MQQIFSQELRFTREDGSSYPEWEEKELGEIGSIHSGQGFTSSEQGGVLGVPFYKVSDMNIIGNETIMKKANNYVSTKQISKRRYKVITKPSIIFAKVGAAIFLERKRIAKDFLIDNNMMAFCPTEDINFMKVIFENIRLSKFAQVGALPSYNASDVKSIKIDLPCLKEQIPIANFLSAIDAKIALVDTQIDGTMNFKKGLLQQMFV